jgi:hypothetical protein
VSNQAHEKPKQSTMKTKQLEIPNLDNLIAEANPKPVVRPAKSPGRPIGRITSRTEPALRYIQMVFPQLVSQRGLQPA